MLDKSFNHNNAEVIRDFLSEMLKGCSFLIEGDNFLSTMVSQKLKCSGFPEFHPRNREEFAAFFNCLHDVFGELDYKVARVYSIGEYAVASIQIKGSHREEFMGLTATGGMLSFNTVMLFKSQAGMIRSIRMFKTKVLLTTAKGNIFVLSNNSLVK